LVNIKTEGLSLLSMHSTWHTCKFVSDKNPYLSLVFWTYGPSWHLRCQDQWTQNKNLL